MATFAEGLRKQIDKLRGIPGEMGLRQVALVVRTVVWPGKLGEGTPTRTDKAITTSGGRSYKVADVSTKDIIASGGKYQAGQLKVGPLTPAYSGGSWTLAELQPPKGSTATEVYYGVTDATGVTQWCRAVELNSFNSLHWYLVLEATGKQAP